jgi:F-type H+-transporting ATPase subunit gamma
MAELQELQQKLDSIKALREIVGAMRNLAALYIRRAESTLRAIRPYAAVVETALDVVLQRLGAGAGEPPADSPYAAIVFASDQGLCGTYNDRVVRAALDFKKRTPGPCHWVAIGSRGSSLLTLRGVDPTLTARAPTSLEGIKAQLPDLAARIFAAYLHADAQRLFFIYNAYEGLGRFQAKARRVLPPSREDLGSSDLPGREPILTDEPAELLGRLIEEYFYIQLHRGLLESHASENGARLVSMTAAGTNIDTRLAELTQEFQTVRQDVITSELLDVIGGAEALQQEP